MCMARLSEAVRCMCKSNPYFFSVTAVPPFVLIQSMSYCCEQHFAIDDD